MFCDTKVKIWNVSSSFNWTLITTYSQHSSCVYALEWLDNDTLASLVHMIIQLNYGLQQRVKLKEQYKQITYVSSLTMLNTNIHLAAGLG
jgi:WD40 repeat protein